MTPDNERKTAPAAAIEWTEDDLDVLAEIHVAEDTALMLAFVAKYGSPRLLALLTAAQEPAPADESADA